MNRTSQFWGISRLLKIATVHFLGVSGVQEVSFGHMPRSEQDFLPAVPFLYQLPVRSAATTQFPSSDLT